MTESETIAWLLGSKTPSIRYFTRVLLLGEEETNPEVIAERDEIEISGPIPVILAEQEEEGHWHGERGYYTPKYVSSHWSMLLLSEFGTRAENPQYRQGAESILDRTMQELQNALDADRHGLTCFWANLLRYTIPSIGLNDARLMLIIQYLVKEAIVTDWRCRHNDELPCAWGAARAAWALALIPGDQRTDEIEDAIESAVNFLINDHRLEEANYPTPGKVHSLWNSLNFPLFYQADILFVLRTLTELDLIHHPGAEAALNWLRDRKGRTGRWRGASPYRQRTWDNLADIEDINRWVTLHALHILSD